MKQNTFYEAIIAVLILGMGLLCGRISAQDKKIADHEVCCAMAESLENYVIDVVFETDIFDDITVEEQAWLDELWDEKNPGPYYIRLIELCEKYYGEKPTL